MKILRLALVVFVIVFAVTFVFLLLQGKALVTRQLENALHRKVNIGYVGLTLPFNVEIKKLDIPGLAKIEHISVSPSIPGLLMGKVILNELKLIKPEITYERKLVNNTQAPPQVQTAEVAMPAAPTPNTQVSHTAKANKKLPSLAFKHLKIKDGTVYFIDSTASGGSIKITVNSLNINVTNLYIYPHSVTTNFDLTGKIPWQEGEQEGSIEAEGWINLFKKDMQASLKFKDIDAIYLYPYYAQWVDLDKARIEKANLNVTSDIKSVDGNLTVPCHLELSNVVFKKPQSEGEEDKTQRIVSAVMDIFSALSKTNKFIFNFTYKGKLPSFY